MIKNPNNILFVLSFIVLVGCDHFPRGQNLALVGEKTGYSGSKVRELTQDNIKVQVEGVFQPEYWGSIKTKWNWVGFKLEISNFDNQEIEVRPDEFVLRVGEKRYGARPYRKVRSRGGITAPAMHERARGFDDQEAFMAASLTKNQTVKGAIEFPRVVFPKGVSNMTLEFFITNESTGKQIPFEIVWKVEKYNF